MFSKINSEFHKHAKGFQIVLGLMIVIPFVFMIPDTDILGPGYSDGAPESVGTINGKSIDWETYQAEAKSFLITQSIQQGAIMNVLQNSNNILSNEEEFMDFHKGPHSGAMGISVVPSNSGPTESFVQMTFKKGKV